MLPSDVNTSCNASGNGSSGVLLSALASRVSETFNGESTVQSICADNYELEEIKDFGDHFLLQSYTVDDLESDEVINSVSVKAPDGTVTVLQVGTKFDDLEDFGAIVNGASIKVNLDVVESILGVEEIDELSEDERKNISIIIGIVQS
jgi:hypothetical protein